MTAHTACESAWRRLDEETRGIGLFERLVDTMTRAALRVAPGSSERKLASSPSEMLIRFGATIIGAPLLKAETRDDLDGLLEQKVETEDFHALLSLLEMRVAPVAGHAHALPTFTVPEWFVERYGRGMAAHLAEGLTLGAAISSAVRELETKIGQRVPSDKRRREPVLDLVRKGRIHPKVSRALIAALKGIAAFYGMAATMIGNRAVEPWLKAALAEAWVAGRREHLRLLASIPGLSVSEELIPAGQRFDHLRLAEDTKGHSEGMQAMLDGARKSGRRVFALPGSDLLG